MANALDDVGVGTAPIFGRLRDSLLITAIRRIVQEAAPTRTPTDTALVILSALEASWERSKLKHYTQIKVEVTLSLLQHDASKGGQRERPTLC